jgi:integrase/recombinase XerD
MSKSALQGPAPANLNPRPKPFKAQGLAYSVVRGPNEAGAWYWRARGPEGAVAWTGWASREELLRTYRVVEPAPELRFETVKDLLTAWLDARGNDPQLRPNSHRAYTFRVHNLIDAVGHDPVESLGVETLDRVHAALLGRGLSPKSVQLHQRALVCATRWGVEEEILASRAVSVPRYRSRAPAVLPHTPTEAEAAAVIAAMTGEDRLAVSILAATGARLAEVTELRRSAIDLRGGWLQLDGKTGPRKFPLFPELRALLKPYADGTDARLFTRRGRAAPGRIYNFLVKTCARLGQTVFSPHGLRRMIVNRVLRSGMDIKTAAELMGHSPCVMLSHYRRVTQEDRAAGVAKAGLGEALAVPTSPAGVGHKSGHKR